MSSHQRQSLTARAGAFQRGPRGSGGLFELRHDLLFGHNQLGHHGGVKNVLALRRRRKLFRCALRIPLPKQVLVPLRKRLCLALGSSLRREFSAELRVISASLASRDGWLILGGFAVKGAWVGEAGWLVDSNGPGITFSACRFAHFLSLFLAGMGTESFCRRYSITAHPISAVIMAIEKFVPVKISVKANLILFPLPLVLVNSPIRRFE